MFAATWLSGAAVMLLAWPAQTSAGDAEKKTISLLGLLEMDAAKTAAVHSRFPGEIVAFGGPGKGAFWRVGDKVRKGDLLAVVWSRDLAVQKGVLADARAEQEIEKPRLARMEALVRDGVAPMAAFEDAKRALDKAERAVASAERTLRLSRLTDAEIAAFVREVAEKKRDPKREQEWARLEIRAPQDGVMIERRVALGDVIGNDFGPLFRIADLSKLMVVAQWPEKDIPLLERLKPEERVWDIQPISDAGAKAVRGKIERIAPMVDREKGTVVVRGPIDNEGGRLRPGQTVRITLVLTPRQKD